MASGSHTLGLNCAFTGYCFQPWSSFTFHPWSVSSSVKWGQSQYLPVKATVKIK